MKRLIKSTIWAGAFLSAVLLVQPATALAQQYCFEVCDSSTPCSTECEIWGGGPSTCGDFSQPCCHESAFTGSGECFTREWLSGTGTCRERDWDYSSYVNMCTSEEWHVLSLTGQNQFGSSQQNCPAYDDCPTPYYF